MITFDVSLEALPGQREAFVALLKRSMAGSQAEDGCLIYRFAQDLEDPSRFYLTELWTDEAALQGHARGPTFKAFLAGLPAVGKVVGSVARSGPLEPYVFVRPKAEEPGS